MNSTNIWQNMANQLLQVSKVNRKTSFKELYKQHFALDSVNKFDGSFSLPGATALKEFMINVDFQTKLQELGYKLSMDGKNWGLVFYQYDSEWYLDVARITAKKLRMGRIVDVYVSTSDTVSIINKNSNEEEQVEINARFWYDENGKVLRQSGYFNGSLSLDNWTPTDKAITYDTTIIPVFDAKNNALGHPDILETAEPILDEMENLWDSIPVEWEKAKIQLVFNKLVNSTNGAKEYEKRIIEEGKSTLEIDDVDGAIANSFSPISLGTLTVSQLYQSIGFYDSKIREMCFLFRDHGQDTRKNEMDLLLFNQKAYESMQTKLLFRKAQLQRMVNMISTITGLKGGTVNLKMVDFEEFRLANLKAIADSKVAQAEQARGIAEKNRMEAETMRINLAKGETVDPTQRQSELAVQQQAQEANTEDTTEDTTVEEE